MTKKYDEFLKLFASKSDGEKVLDVVMDQMSENTELAEKLGVQFKAKDRDRLGPFDDGSMDMEDFAKAVGKAAGVAAAKSLNERLEEITESVAELSDRFDRIEEGTDDSVGTDRGDRGSSASGRKSVDGDDMNDDIYSMLKEMNDRLGDIEDDLPPLASISSLRSGRGKSGRGDSGDYEGEESFQDPLTAEVFGLWG